MLKDRGLLRRDGETWRLDAADVDVPETVQGIIAARLDALNLQEKGLLQAASVVGKVFWLGSAAAMTGLSDWEAEEVLHDLERRELVRRDRRASVAGETEYAVRHVLVRDVAYGQIPRARRAELHLGAAAWIESLGADRADDRAEMLAHHYLSALDLTRAAGGDTSRLEEPAARALRAAGRRAYALSALDAAVGFYQGALELWSPDDRDYPRLLLELGSGLFWAQSGGAAELEEAAERLLAAGDVEGAAEAESYLGGVHWLAGAQQEARAHHDRAVALVADLPDTRTTATIRARAWRRRLLANEQPPFDEGRRLLALAEELGTAEDVFEARIDLGLALIYGGDPASGIAELEIALDETRRANSHIVTRAYINLASLLGTSGELRRSRELHREGLEFAGRFTSHHTRWLAAECLTDDYYAGDWDRAIDGVWPFLENRGAMQYMDCAAHSVLATTAAARGDRSLSENQATHLLSRAREIGDPQVLWGALGQCARLALERGDEPEARALVAELAAAYAGAGSLQVNVYDVDGFLVAHVLGVGEGLGEQLAKASYETPWVATCRLVAAGRLDEAAATLHAHEAYAYAALVRLYAAEQTGRETPGLREAVTFYESVGATAYLARAERLLQASA